VFVFSKSQERVLEPPAAGLLGQPAAGMTDDQPPPQPGRRNRALLLRAALAKARAGRSIRLSQQARRAIAIPTEETSAAARTSPPTRTRGSSPTRSSRHCRSAARAALGGKLPLPAGRHRQQLSGRAASQRQCSGRAARRSSTTA
jgi:hypothetical protein